MPSPNCEVFHQVPSHSLQIWRCAPFSSPVLASVITSLALNRSLGAVHFRAGEALTSARMVELAARGRTAAPTGPPIESGVSPSHLGPCNACHRAAPETTVIDIVRGGVIPDHHLLSPRPRPPAVDGALRVRFGGASRQWGLSLRLWQCQCT